MLSRPWCFAGSYPASAAPAVAAAAAAQASASASASAAIAGSDFWQYVGGLVDNR